MTIGQAIQLGVLTIGASTLLLLFIACAMAFAAWLDDRRLR